MRLKKVSLRWPQKPSIQLRLSEVYFGRKKGVTHRRAASSAWLARLEVKLPPLSSTRMIRLPVRLALRTNLSSRASNRSVSTLLGPWLKRNGPLG